MKEFGKNEYKNVLYANFDLDERLRGLFDKDYDIDRILLALQALTGVNVKAGETLIVLDEIQEVNRGLGVLKYFCENAPEHHVMVAGSLLGIALHPGTSFPVGKVDMIDIHWTMRNFFGQQATNSFAACCKIPIGNCCRH